MKKLLNKFQNPSKPISLHDKLELPNESTRVSFNYPKLKLRINPNDLSDYSWLELGVSDDVVNVYPSLKNDKYILEFFEHDYAPRFKRYNKDVKLDYVDLARSIYLDTPINLYNNDNYLGGYESNNIREIYNNKLLSFINSVNDKPEIYLNTKFRLNRPVIVHELTHAFRLGHLGTTGDNKFSSYSKPIFNIANGEIGKYYEGSGYSNIEKSKLNNAYDMTGYKLEYDPLLEKGTTNTEVRFRLWKELYSKLGRIPKLLETNDFILNYDNNKLQDMIKHANSYGHRMYDNGINTKDVKDALIHVAQNTQNDKSINYAKHGIKLVPRYKKSNLSYYDKKSDTIYAPDSTGEFYKHELFHARPDSIALDRLKPFYENLNDDRLLLLGADLSFVKLSGDPGVYYSPEELGARVLAARYMLKKNGINNINNRFLDNIRKSDRIYGDNFRDLLHMYNNDNLIKILGNRFLKGGKL